MQTIKNHIGKIISALLLFVGIMFVIPSANAVYTKDQQIPDSLYRSYTFFATSSVQTDYSTSTSATSTNVNQWTDTDGKMYNGAFVIAGAEKVSFVFGRDGHLGANTGATTFNIQVTDDGSNWYDYNKLWQNIATGTYPTTAKNITISAATSSTVVGMEMKGDAFYAVRCIVVETTDGFHYCKASAQW